VSLRAPVPACPGPSLATSATGGRFASQDKENRRDIIGSAIAVKVINTDDEES
jgi:hypothetical protein